MQVQKNIWFLFVVCVWQVDTCSCKARVPHVSSFIAQETGCKLIVLEQAISITNMQQKGEKKRVDQILFVFFTPTTYCYSLYLGS